MQQDQFQRVASVNALAEKGRMVVKRDGKQIVLFQGKKVFMPAITAVPMRAIPWWKASCPRITTARTVF